jgi:hypothetical protein
MDKDIRDIDLAFKFINITMEKRIFGFMMTVLGIVGFLLASFYLTQMSTRTGHPILSSVLYGIPGLLFFFAGIGLIRNTQDLTADSSDLIGSATDNMEPRDESVDETKKIRKAPFR